MKIERDIESTSGIIDKLNEHKDEIKESLQKCEREYEEVEHIKIGGFFKKLNFEETMQEIKEKSLLNLEEVIDKIKSNNNEFEDVDSEIGKDIK